ncbi:unnamed protein product [Rotaria magnacalcarata]
MLNLCYHIFTVFIQLTYLIFYESSYEHTVRLLFYVPSRRFSSSTLLVLGINVQCFHHCLFILDGRFNHLHTLHIHLANLRPPEAIVNSQAEIPNLKCFVLSCVLPTYDYDPLIPSLVHRMSNLEKLGLHLTIHANATFIDGNSLKKDILNHMPKLNVFSFDIHSIAFTNNLIYLPSKEDIQQAFRHFPCGLYQYVRVVSFRDTRPFEHEFFIQITQSFPFMENLSVNNRHSQNQKQSVTSMNDNHNLSIANYCYLTRLSMRSVHDDYIEEIPIEYKNISKIMLLLISIINHYKK